MGRLLLLFIVLPAVELALLIEIGQRIGTLETLALIVVTGVVGASLARSQGLQLIARVQEQLGRGEMPADSLVDGLMILVASALLVTPGILTDIFGFLCLTPGFRTLVKREVIRRFERAVAENRIHVDTSGFTDDFTRREGRPTVIDVTPPRDGS
jgi:UPF0716 protein FxsA